MTSPWTPWSRRSASGKTHDRSGSYTLAIAARTISRFATRSGLLRPASSRPSAVAATPMTKSAVDEDRRAGRFLLTGSANLLHMREVSESLAGRATYLTLWPLTRREQLGLGEPGRWSAFLDTSPTEWLDLLSDDDAPAEDWRDLARRG